MRSAATVAIGGRSPMIASIATDLPDPDSPTIAKTSLRSSARSNPSTAAKAPWRVAKETQRLQTSRRGMEGALKRSWRVGDWLRQQLRQKPLGSGPKCTPIQASTDHGSDD